ncbi:MAG: hypothetical protein D3917_13495 [Candidatus Electrothrix sp. AX5]|nr:hypothetical protein [Candidatus Electrothrix sp. AX5]
MELMEVDGILLEVELSEAEQLQRVSNHYGLGGESNVRRSDDDNLKLSIIKKIARQVEFELEETRASEAEVSFGLKISNEGHMYISNNPKKSNINIKLRWDRKERV